MPLNIVLVNPQIPQTTGHVARICAATGSVLHLVQPLGYDLSDPRLKLTGIDYWGRLTYHVWPDLECFLRETPRERMYFTSSKASRGHYEVAYRDGDYLIFGCETYGLPEKLLFQVYDRSIRIPMLENARSLSLSNAVGIVLYEALRQMNYEGLTARSSLTGYDEREISGLEFL